MQLLSDAFSDGAPIPPKYTQDGANVSPPLAWRDVPPGTRSLAMIVEDVDVPTPDDHKRVWVHWVLVDLPPDTGGIPEAVASPPGQAHVGRNDWDATEWSGPAPPSGVHHYHFRLYALDRELGLPRPTRDELERAMRGHVLAESTLVGTYQAPS